MQAESTPATTYRYPAEFRWLARLLTLLAFLSPPMLGLCVCTIAITQPRHLLPLLLFPSVGFMALVQGAVFVLVANSYPEVAADAQGIYARFLGFRLLVPWQDILDLQPSRFDRRERPSAWVVQTRRLTPFHRLYGLLYALSPHPSFLIHRTLEGHEDLIEKIERRTYD